MFNWLFKKSTKKESIPVEAFYKLEENSNADISDPILRIGDSVVVNQGVKDPDSKKDIGGRFGRIFGLSDDDIVTIQWDIITLRNLPSQEIEKFEKKGMDWSEINLEKNEITKAKPRDTIEDAEKEKDRLESMYYWTDFGAQGKRIKNVIMTAKSDDVLDIYEAWKKHFEKSLVFPFEGIVYDWDKRKPFKDEDEINVLAISDSEIDEMYGVFASVKKKSGAIDFPFCAIEPIRKQSQNGQVLDDYSVWFSNRP